MCQTSKEAEDRRTMNPSTRENAESLAAHAVGTPARSTLAGASRHRDRGYRAWACARRAMERTDDGDHAFSVAQHSLVVTDILDALEPDFTSNELSRGAASRRARICDRRSYQPFKTAIGLDYKAFELQSARRDPSPVRRWAIEVSLPTTAIKDADTDRGLLRSDAARGLRDSGGRIVFWNSEVPKELHSDLADTPPRIGEGRPSQISFQVSTSVAVLTIRAILGHFASFSCSAPI